MVTFVLGLFFLLKLKFCIPPSVDLGAGVAAGLSVAFGPDFAKLDAALSASVLNDIAASQGTDFSSSAPEGVPVDPAPPGAAKAELPSVTANLIYEERQEVPR